MRARLALLAVLTVTAVACSSAPKGLGAKACPYLRPRLLRLDLALSHSAPPGSQTPLTANDVSAVARDVALYVAALPAGGKARSDQPLVRFSAALGYYAAPTAARPTAGPAAPPDLASAEAAVKHECGVTLPS